MLKKNASRLRTLSRLLRVSAIYVDGLARIHEEWEEEIDRVVGRARGARVDRATFAGEPKNDDKAN